MVVNGRSKSINDGWLQISRQISSAVRRFLSYSPFLSASVLIVCARQAHDDGMGLNEKKGLFNKLPGRSTLIQESGQNERYIIKKLAKVLPHQVFVFSFSFLFVTLLGNRDLWSLMIFLGHRYNHWKACILFPTGNIFIRKCSLFRECLSSFIENNYLLYRNNAPPPKKTCDWLICQENLLHILLWCMLFLRILLIQRQLFISHTESLIS